MYLKMIEVGNKLSSAFGKNGIAVRSMSLIAVPVPSRMDPHDFTFNWIILLRCCPDMIVGRTIGRYWHIPIRFNRERKMALQDRKPHVIVHEVLLRLSLIKRTEKYESME
jgi:hypothetical protein